MFGFFDNRNYIKPHLNQKPSALHTHINCAFCLHSNWSHAEPKNTRLWQRPLSKLSKDIINSWNYGFTTKRCKTETTQAKTTQVKPRFTWFGFLDGFWWIHIRCEQIFWLFWERRAILNLSYLIVFDGTFGTKVLSVIIWWSEMHILSLIKSDKQYFQAIYCVRCEWDLFGAPLEMNRLNWRRNKRQSHLLIEIN